MKQLCLTWADFGQHVRNARLAAQYSQQQLADHIGCHRSYITKLEIGKSHPSVKMLRMLAAACPHLRHTIEIYVAFENMARYHVDTSDINEHIIA